MRLPSLTRIPKNSRFNYAPRFYDPIKEDIQLRTSKIQGQILNRKNADYRSNITNAFSRRARENRHSNIIQLVIIVLLLATFFGYIYYGSNIFYIFLTFIPVYIFYRAKNAFRRK